MKCSYLILASLAFGLMPAQADEISTFHAYIDSDVCARLLLGPITDSRTQCTLKTFKEGSDIVVVRLSDNSVLSPNKDKMLKPYVGKIASVSGEMKLKNGTVKVQSASPEEASAIPKGDPARRLLDASARTPSSPQTVEKIRHELAMMPYISQFDFISFVMSGREVILTGWTVRETNRSEAFNRVKSIPGVETVTNNIEVLPLGSFDNQIRVGVRASLQRTLSRYFWGSGSDIRIVVKNGSVILLGAVANQADADMANVQVNGVPMVFHVFNMLRVRPGKG